MAAIAPCCGVSQGSRWGSPQAPPSAGLGEGQSCRPLLGASDGAVKSRVWKQKPLPAETRLSPGAPPPPAAIAACDLPGDAQHGGVGQAEAQVSVLPLSCPFAPGSWWHLPGATIFTQKPALEAGRGLGQSGPPGSRPVGVSQVATRQDWGPPEGRCAQPGTSGRPSLPAPAPAAAGAELIRAVRGPRQCPRPPEGSGLWPGRGACRTPCLGPGLRAGFYHSKWHVRPSAGTHSEGHHRGQVAGRVAP